MYEAVGLTIVYEAQRGGHVHMVNDNMVRNLVMDKGNMENVVLQLD